MPYVHVGEDGGIAGQRLSVFFGLIELNAEIEHQTVKDTTRGPDEPMGQRDAYVADTTPDRSA